MKFTVLITLCAASLSLSSCQKGKLTLTPQEEAAGVAALISIGNSVQKKEKPAPAAVDAGLAALKAYQAGAVVAAAPPSGKTVSQVAP